MGLPEKVMNLQRRHYFLRASLEGVVMTLDAWSADDPDSPPTSKRALKLVADTLKEILEKDKLD